MHCGRRTRHLPRPFQAHSASQRRLHGLEEAHIAQGIRGRPSKSSYLRRMPLRQACAHVCCHRYYGIDAGAALVALLRGSAQSPDGKLQERIAHGGRDYVKCRVHTPTSHH